MWRSSRAAGAWVLVACLLSACAAPKVFLSPHFLSARRVAVLPMSNESNDLDGPLYVRQLIFNHLAARGYHLIPLAEVDAHLKEQGFTQGGQLAAASPQKLGEWLGADTLFFSNLESFDYINVGFYWQRKVKIDGRLVDAVSGERIWEAEREATTRQLVTDKKAAEREFAIQLAAKAVEKMAHIPLQLESRIAVELLLNALPNRP